MKHPVHAEPRPAHFPHPGAPLEAPVLHSVTCADAHYTFLYDSALRLRQISLSGPAPALFRLGPETLTGPGVACRLLPNGLIASRQVDTGAARANERFAYDASGRVRLLSITRSPLATAPDSVIAYFWQDDLLTAQALYHHAPGGLRLDQVRRYIYSSQPNTFRQHIFFGVSGLAGLIGPGPRLMPQAVALGGPQARPLPFNTRTDPSGAIAGFSDPLSGKAYSLSYAPAAGVYIPQGV